MQAYILGVCGAVVISALITILLPEGKTGKFIGGILKLFCVAVMLLPVPALLREVGVTGGGSGGEMQPDEAFIDAVFSRRAEEEEETLEGKIDEEVGVTALVDILWECEDFAYTVEEIDVKIEDFGIYGADRHIFVIEQVEACVREWYSAEVNVHA